MRTSEKRLFNTDTAYTETMRQLTSGLTGRREMDIDYLRRQIDLCGNDQNIVDALRRILQCLTGTGTCMAAA